MRKILYTLTVVLLIGAVIVGCGKKENPFEPITSSYLPSTAMESLGPTVTDIATLDGDNALFQNPAYDEIGILFDADINPATVTTSTIKLQDVESMATALAYTVSYIKATKKAVIKITNGWDDDLSYLVTVTTGVKDIHGHALDGNDNNWVDPQDNKKVQFWGNNSTVLPVDLIPPTISILNPSNEEIYFSLADTIRIRLRDNDSVDVTTITADAFVLTTASGQIVNLPTMNIDVTSAPTEYIVRFNPLTNLQEATDYYLTVKTSIKDKKGNTLDGNGNGIAEAEALDRERIKFRTYDPRNGGIPSISNLRVIGTSFTDDNRALLISFNRKMNPAYLNSNYIKIYNNNDYTGYAQGTITILPDTMTVKYTLENFDGSGVIWVSRTVRDTSGLMLDENNNGIPGEAAYTTDIGVYKPSDDLLKGASFSTGFHYILFYDMVESGNIGWTTQGTTPQLWHRSTIRASENPNYGGNYAWYCGLEADTSYLYTPIAAVHDTLRMPIIDLTWYDHATFTFDYIIKVDPGLDYFRAQYRSRNTDGTWSSWNTWLAGSFVAAGWTTNQSYSIPATGTQVQIAIMLDTDAIGNTNEGIWVDNIRVIAW